MVITAQQNENGKWILISKKDSITELRKEEYQYNTKDDAMMSIQKRYPSNSIWEGKMVAHGWEISLD